MTPDASHLVAGVNLAGAFFMLPAPMSDYAAGDRFWAGGLSETWQLRPALFSDLPDDLWMRPGVWMLARRFSDIAVDMRVLVAAAPIAANTPLDVLRVVRQMGEQGSVVGGYVMQLEAHSVWARSQFPRPTFEHREVLFLERDVVSERQEISGEVQQ